MVSRMIRPFDPHLAICNRLDEAKEVDGAACREKHSSEEIALDQVLPKVVTLVLFSTAQMDELGVMQLCGTGEWSSSWMRRRLTISN
jgi:hypothetical protein